MRVLILGGGGMLGHKLWQVFRDRFETWVTFRTGYRDCARYGLFEEARTVGDIDAFDPDSVVRALITVRPDVVINCIGIIKQLPTAKDPIVSLTVNSLFPHRLANLCTVAGIRLIHISTDCVFSGRKGMYTETDNADAEDLYGRTKFLGEVAAPTALTLRTSIIGRELSTRSGLVEWFLSNHGEEVRGYSRAIYTGFTTLVLAQIIGDLIERQPGLSGVYHVSSEPINKCNLLSLLRDAFGVEIYIEPYAEVDIDRSLDSTRFRQITGFQPPTWPEMIHGLAADASPYEVWRTQHGV